MGLFRSTRARFVVILILAGSLLVIDAVRKHRREQEQKGHAAGRGEPADRQPGGSPDHPVR